MNTYLFFGDSVTEAHRNKLCPDDLGQGFVHQLSQIFNEDNFINRGISGQRIKDLLKRVESDVIALKPDVCFIWVGINDAWLPYLLYQESSIYSFYNDYDELIQKIAKGLEHTEIVLIKPYAMLMDKVSEDILNDMNLFRSDVEKLGNKYKLTILDIKDHFENRLVLMPANQMFFDGIHPTLFGYELITDVMTNYIKGRNI